MQSAEAASECKAALEWLFAKMQVKDRLLIRPAGLPISIRHRKLIQVSQQCLSTRAIFERSLHLLVCTIH